MDLEKLLRDLLAEAAELSKKGLDLTEEEVARTGELVTQIADTKQKIADRKAASAQLAPLLAAPTESAGPAAAEPSQGTIGQRFVASEAYKSWKATNPNPQSKAEISIKAQAIGSRYRALKDDEPAAPAPAGPPAPLNTRDNGDRAPVRLPGIEDVTYRKPTTLLDLIYQGPTEVEYLEYRQLIAVTNNASVVAEATTTTGEDAASGLKPLSTLTTKTETAHSFTYADGVEVTNQELKDDGALTALIDGVLTDNVRHEIERVVLNGSGADGEPIGIMNTTGVLEQAFTDDFVTTIRKAKTLLWNTSSTSPQAILLNGEDDEALDLLKDDMGRYYGNGPFGTGPSTVWAIPRVTTDILPVGTALMGNFSAVQLLIYEAMSIVAFNQHKDYAQRNLSYVRGELRALQLFRQPAKLAVVELA